MNGMLYGSDTILGYYSDDGVNTHKPHKGRGDKNHFKRDLLKQIDV